MRRLAAFLPVVAVALAACSSAAEPGWTYAPAPSASAAASGAVASGSPAASAGASAAPSTAASTAPSAAPSAGGSAPAGSAGASSGTALTITAPVGASTGGFQPATATAAANTAFNLIFDNQDNQAPHNLILQNPDGSNVQVSGDTAFFTGPGQRQLGVPALAAGAYTFLCQVHPTTMKGTLTVQ